MQPKPLVLIVEDDANIREIIRSRLLAAGYDIATARNGVDALTHIAICRPDAIVLDINMPELDGFGVLDEMRRAQGPSIPTLILTARHAQADVKRAMELGARDYLTKPFTEGQLAARVARLLRFAPQPAPSVLL